MYSLSVKQVERVKKSEMEDSMFLSGKNHS